MQRLGVDRQLKAQLGKVEDYLRKQDSLKPTEGPPVIFFNSSTRIQHLSLNGAYSLLASWGVRAAGVPVRYVVCNEGLQQCILGTDRTDYTSPPPCHVCMKTSNTLFPADKVIPLTPPTPIRPFDGPQIESMSALQEWSYKDYPVGELCLPGVRWALRRHNLPDDEPTRGLYHQYLRSAAKLIDDFERIIDQTSPQALVVFNGVFYPEAIARTVAIKKGVPVITHEVGLGPFSTFFSHGLATFRNAETSLDRPLDKVENARLDEYLEDRYQGRFTMAGIRFWPEMMALPETLTSKIGEFKQMVSVFTNVVFDTSQVHANTIYEHMFEWLEDLAQAIDREPGTLFVIRAHPDEDRPGKESLESVSDWITGSGLLDHSNVYFVPPSVFVSSYELIRRSKFVLIYNSSIGLEASIMGAVVLSAGRARFTDHNTVSFPADRAGYRETLNQLLRGTEIHPPNYYVENSRRFLHFELNRASLDLSSFLRPYPGARGMVSFKTFQPQDLLKSVAVQVMVQGILESKPFAME